VGGTFRPRFHQHEESPPSVAPRLNPKPGLVRCHHPLLVCLLSHFHLLVRRSWLQCWATARALRPRWRTRAVSCWGGLAACGSSRRRRGAGGGVGAAGGAGGRPAVDGDWGLARGRARVLDELAAGALREGARGQHYPRLPRGRPPQFLGGRGEGALVRERARRGPGRDVGQTLVPAQDQDRLHNWPHVQHQGDDLEARGRGHERRPPQHVARRPRQPQEGHRPRARVQQGGPLQCHRPHARHQGLSVLLTRFINKTHPRQCGSLSRILKFSFTGP
jgi:hypothetical protein